MAKENPILVEEESPMYEDDSTSGEELTEYKEFKKLVFEGDPVKLCEGADDSDPGWLMDEACYGNEKREITRKIQEMYIICFNVLVC